ncbi:MAG: AMP-binding protein [Pelagibacterales bacterium]|jgi:long-subunit acyl-CoA synthetase (AMP-forming)|nr:AMP-binding protein [Pelagibacterales bacterium]MDG1831105.1 AMP-binding protein [Flavobacteriaceae bacterium]
MIDELFDFPFYKWEEKLKNKPFLKQPFGDLWENYTWEQVGNMARKLSTGLKSMGLPEKSHIGLVSKNCREWIIADLAISMSGHISVPFFPTLKSYEIEKLLDFGDVSALFVGKLENWEEMKQGVRDDMPIIAFPHYKDHSKISEGKQWYDFINEFDAQTEDFKPKLKDIWTIIFTSGTTGDPKGVVLTYETLYNTKRITEDGNPLKVDFSGNNDFISYMPLNHIFERVVIEHSAFRFGGTISFVESLETFGQNLNDVKPTAFQGVPRIYSKFQEKILMKMSQKKLSTLLKIPIISFILKKKLRGALGMSRVRSLVTGAAAMPLELLDWYKSIGIYITNGYGMTENCATCTNLNPYQPLGRGSVGKATSGVDLKISEQGEILMKGPFTLTCYYKNEEITNQTLRDGWLYTGDKGYIDDDGFLYITGRVKDIFKTSKGKYIEPGVLETYFGNINEFSQLCVVGLACDQPLLMAVPSELAIKNKESVSIKLAKILEEVNEKLDNYKKISKIILVKEDWVPENGMTTPTLKIKRAKIDEKFSDKYGEWEKSENTVIWE